MDRERYKPYERPADRNNVASPYRHQVKMKKYLSILETKRLKLKVSLSSPSSRACFLFRIIFHRSSSIIFFK